MNQGDESKSVPFFEKLGQVFRDEGQEERRISYLCGWVTRFGKFLQPKRYHEAVASDIESFLRKLAGEGHEAWKIQQADEALRVLYTRL